MAIFNSFLLVYQAGYTTTSAGWTIWKTTHLQMIKSQLLSNLFEQVKYPTIVRLHLPSADKEIRSSHKKARFVGEY